MVSKTVLSTWTQLSLNNCAVKNFGTKKIFIGFGLTAPTGFLMEQCFELPGNEQITYALGTGVWAISTEGDIVVTVQEF